MVAVADKDTLMIEIVVENKQVTEILPMVQSMRERGWVQGRDFDFTYHPAEYRYTWDQTAEQRTVFTFYREEIATVFALTYL